MLHNIAKLKMSINNTLNMNKQKLSFYLASFICPTLKVSCGWS